MAEINQPFDSIANQLITNDSIFSTNWINKNKSKPAIDTIAFNIKLHPQENYEQLIKELELQRKKIFNQYILLNSEKEKSIFFDSVGIFYTHFLVNKLIPHWYGMSWNLAGYSDVPNQGTVGCGYFVSNLLRHSGFRINRFRGGQTSPPALCKTVQLSDSVYEVVAMNFDNVYEKIKADIKDGIYVCGLACHVGFLLKRKSQLFFIHSDYTGKCMVRMEYANYSDVFSSSSVYYIGEISTNKKLLFQWLNNDEITVRKPSE